MQREDDRDQGQRADEQRFQSDATRDAASGLGMSNWQQLVQVELPLAAPLVFTGIRIAAVQVISGSASRVNSVEPGEPAVQLFGKAVPGLVIATGMSGHGFGIGPGFGRVVADLVMGNDVGHDLGRFRLERFSDGSPIVIDGGF